MDLNHFIAFISNPKALIAAFGLLGIFFIIFLETGFFFGFFLPGDSLLFTAGLLATQGYIPISWLIIGVFIAAVAGDSIGYAFGKRVGPTLFVKDDSTFFDRKNINRAQHFYEKYGARTIVFARFLPVVRTFAPIVAGIGEMKYKTFLGFNIIGAFLWTVLLIGLGYGFGRAIPDPDSYLLPAVIFIIILSGIPALIEFLRRRRKS